MNVAVLFLAFNLILPSGSDAPRKTENAPRIAANKKVVVIHGFGGIYLYYPATDSSEFVLQFAVNDVAVKFVAELDKADKPRRLLLLAKRGARPAQKFFFEKIDANNKDFFKFAENAIDTFVREYKVREVLKKYKRRK